MLTSLFGGDEELGTRPIPSEGFKKRGQDWMARSKARAAEAQRQAALMAAGLTEEEQRGLFSRGRQEANRQAATMNEVASGYGKRAADMFSSGREQAQRAADEAMSSSYGQQASSWFSFGRDKAFSTVEAAKQSGLSQQTQELLAKGKSSAFAAHKQGTQVLSQAGDQLQKGYSSVRDNLVPRLTKDRLDFTGLQAAGFGSIGAMLLRRKLEAYDVFFAMSSPLRMQLLLAFREMVKERAVADPDLPSSARARIETAVDRFWTDLIIYQERLIEDAKLQAQGVIPSDHAELAAVGNVPVPLSPFWWRAHILYHFMPFDKSIWGCMKDPFWWIMTIISCTTIFGIRIVFFLVLLILICRGCPPDEYQLVSYILTFKGTQVISSGILRSIVASVLFFLCINGDGSQVCSEWGPGAKEDLISGMIDFVGSSVLVWIAFFCLPCSGNSAGSRDLDGALADLDDFHGAVSDFSGSDAGSGSDGSSSPRRNRCCCCPMRCCRRRWDPTRGGRLAGLLCWDFFSVSFSLALLVVCSYVDVSHSRPGGRPPANLHVNITTVGGIETTMRDDFGSWEFRLSFYMIRIFYAFLSLPFVFFTIPVLNGILTHTTPTGYNTQGVCVPFTLRPMPEKKGI